MKTSLNEWKALFSAENSPKVLVLAGGISLHAINIFVGATLMPSIVKDIGGVDLLAWNTTLYILASMLASVFVGHRPERLCPSDVYIIGVVCFAVGSLLCGTSPRMMLMLVGRSFQGAGAGILVAISYSMIRILFPQGLWPRALALMSVVWGAATLAGPALGGIMASSGLWRLSFLMLLPAAGLLAFLSRSILPKHFMDSTKEKVPAPQIILLCASVLLLSIAGTVARDLVPATTFLGLGLLCALAVVWFDNSRSARLFPRGAFSLKSPLLVLYLSSTLIYACQASEIYLPYFLQTLKKLPPLWAGYIVAMIAVGWTLGAIFSAGLSGSKARSAVVIGSLATVFAFVGLWIFLPSQTIDDGRMSIGAIAICLSTLGVGIGLFWPHLQTEILSRAPPGEADLTSASIPLIQQFASAFGAAVAGWIVNRNGLADGVGPGEVSNAAASLYLYVSLTSALIFPLLILVTRGFPSFPSALDPIGSADDC